MAGMNQFQREERHIGRPREPDVVARALLRDRHTARALVGRAGQEGFEPGALSRDPAAVDLVTRR